MKPERNVVGVAHLAAITLVIVAVAPLNGCSESGYWMPSDTEPAPEPDLAGETDPGPDGSGSGGSDGQSDSDGVPSETEQGTAGSDGSGAVDTPGSDSEDDSASVTEDSGLIVLPDWEFVALAEVDLRDAGDGDLPSSKDLSVYLSPPEDQGEAPACVAFVLAAMKTLQERRECGPGGWDSSLNENRFDPWFIAARLRESGFEYGATYRAGFNILRHHGVLTVQQSTSAGEDAPYVTIPETYKIEDWGKVRDNDIVQVKLHLLADESIALSIRVYPTWQGLAAAGDDAVYSSIFGDSITSHAVLAVGYDDVRRAVKVRNSRGPDWGDRGYAWIPYDIWPQVVQEAYAAIDRIDPNRAVCNPNRLAQLSLDAGRDQLVPSGTEVQLIGAVHDGVAPFSFSWTRVTGPASVTIMSAWTSFASVSLDVAGDYAFRFSVVDATERAGTDDVRVSVFADCNSNGTDDLVEIVGATSGDCNGNGIPDECDLADETSEDCNQNNIPDECDITDEASLDCQPNGTPDECELADSDCNDNGIPDQCDLADGTSEDCNQNNIPDECDITDGASLDCQPNGTPDECDLANATSADCNQNTVPDTCDISLGTSQDESRNGIPDECQEFRTVTLMNGQSYDFSARTPGTSPAGGDLYYSSSTTSFWANNTGQGGVIDLGFMDLGDVPSVPDSGYSSFDVSAIVGHTYAALPAENGNWILMHVTAVGPSSVTVDWKASFGFAETWLPGIGELVFSADFENNALGETMLNPTPGPGLISLLATARGVIAPSVGSHNSTAVVFDTPNPGDRISADFKFSRPATGSVTIEWDAIVTDLEGNSQDAVYVVRGYGDKPGGSWVSTWWFRLSNNQYQGQVPLLLGEAQHFRIEVDTITSTYTVYIDDLPAVTNESYAHTGAINQRYFHVLSEVDASVTLGIDNVTAVEHIED